MTFVVEYEYWSSGKLNTRRAHIATADVKKTLHRLIDDYDPTKGDGYSCTLQLIKIHPARLEHLKEAE